MSSLPVAAFCLDTISNAAAFMAIATDFGFSADEGRTLTLVAKKIGEDAVARDAFVRIAENAFAKGEKITDADIAGTSIDTMEFLKVLIVSLVPAIREKHATLGLPVEVTTETVERLADVLARNVPETIVAGSPWFGKYYRETMFDAGIFQYVLGKFSEKGAVTAYRRWENGDTIALASPGLPIDDEGCVVREGDAYRYKTELEETSDRVRGYLVAPQGRLSGKQIAIEKDEWERVLYPGGPILETHIPRGRSMKFDDCGRSLRQAAEILKRHFATSGVRCITCQSWILNPDWDALMPESNLAKFERELYLYPLPSSPDGGFNFVFGKPAAELDIKALPRETSLQKIMLDRYEKGLPLRVGGMFVLTEHVERFGTRYYRTTSRV